MLLVDSWLFLFASAVLLLGYGSSSSEGACAAAIHFCIAFCGFSPPPFRIFRLIFYRIADGSSKVVMYLFLSEYGSRLLFSVR